MRALVQRVSRARVLVTDDLVGQIDRGILIFLGIHREDKQQDAEWLARKVLHLRIFDDERGKMNRSVIDIGGGVLVVPQFTLYGETKKGNRPSYTDAASPDYAKSLCNYFCQLCENSGILVAAGQFQAYMTVELVNDGPVTLWCDTQAS
jgi:D-tyrosyl-tRNA(Tyr) deacylase